MHIAPTYDPQGLNGLFQVWVTIFFHILWWPKKKQTFFSFLHNEENAKCSHLKKWSFPVPVPPFFGGSWGKGDHQPVLPGANPLNWTSQTPYAFGLQLPSTLYTQQVIRQARGWLPLDSVDFRQWFRTLGGTPGESPSLFGFKISGVYGEEVRMKSMKSMNCWAAKQQTQGAFTWCTPNLGSTTMGWDHSGLIPIVGWG